MLCYVMLCYVMYVCMYVYIQYIFMQSSEFFLGLSGVANKLLVLIGSD